MVKVTSMVVVGRAAGGAAGQAPVVGMGKAGVGGSAGSITWRRPFEKRLSLNSLSGVRKGDDEGGSLVISLLP